jgi:hypothetical protein
MDKNIADKEKRRISLKQEVSRFQMEQTGISGFHQIYNIQWEGPVEAYAFHSKLKFYFTCFE